MNERNKKSVIESVAIQLTSWVGSTSSIVVHTCLFILFFLAGLLRIADWSALLLVLTTLVSLEAIYLSIFIQMTVNRHTESLKEVESDIDEISDDIDELGEDVGEIREDVEDIQEGVEEISEDVEEITEDDKKDDVRDERADAALASMQKTLQTLMDDIEKLKSNRE